MKVLDLTNRIAFGAVILLALLSASHGAAGQPLVGTYLTNVELMQLVVRSSLTEALRELPEVEGGRLACRSLEQSEIDWMVENELLNALARGGVEVSVQKATPAARTSRKKKGSLKEGVQFDTAPELISGEGIAYPEEACEKGLGGSVDVLLLINENGSVANTVIEQSSDDLFEAAVKEGISSYRYRPAMNDEVSVVGEVILRFEFPANPDGCREARVMGVSGDESEKAPEPAQSARASQSTPDAPLPVLTYRVSEFEMTYPRAKRRLWVGPRRVDRFARARIDLRLQRGDSVSWARSVEHYVSDRVPSSSLRLLESTQYEFARPDLPAGSSRHWEPFVVAGVVGGLVALFYSNQAGD